MSKLASTMTLYAAYHQDHRNRLTHFIGVPAIVFSVVLLLTYARIDLNGVPLSLASLFILGMAGYYMTLDRMIGAALLIVTLPMLFAAEWLMDAPLWVGLLTIVVAFVGGWAFQLLGHRFEGNKPALMTGLWQMAMAPLFLCAEACFMLGLRRDLEQDVNNRVAAFIAEHGKPGVTGTAPVSTRTVSA
jgi:uncharacterized membrane protein YGL010W